MSKFSVRLRTLRKSRDLSQQKLAEYLGTSKSSVNMYERGEREPGLDMLENIADFFNVDMDYLHGKSTVPNRSLCADACEDVYKNLPSPTLEEETVTFPVIGEIAAGYNNYALEDWEGDTVNIPKSFLKGRGREDFFVLRIKGDSMYPHYQENDRVLILKQDFLDYNGQVAAVMYDDELSTLKKVEYGKQSNINLVPINPSIPPIRIEGERAEHCRVIGVPKYLIREIDDLEMKNVGFAQKPIVFNKKRKQEEKTYSIKKAARNGDFEEKAMTESDIQKIKNLPDVDDLE